MALERKPSAAKQFGLVDAGRQWPELPDLGLGKEAQEKLAAWWNTARTGLQRQLAQIEAELNKGNSAPATEASLQDSVELGDSVTAQTEFGMEADPGTSEKAARADHEHGTPEDPMPAHLEAEDPHPQYLRVSELPAQMDNTDLIVAFGGGL